MVGGLVEEQDLRSTEEDAGEFDSTTLTSRERAERLIQNPLWESDTGGDGISLRLHGVPAECLELRLRSGISTDQAIALGGISGPHAEAGLLHAAHHVIEAAGGKDPVLGDLIRVAGARILRKVADRPRHVDGARGRLGLLGEDPRQRGLTGSVAADQADAVTAADAKGGVLDEQRGAGPNLEAGGGNHDCLILVFVDLEVGVGIGAAKRRQPQGRRKGGTVRG